MQVFSDMSTKPPYQNINEQKRTKFDECLIRNSDAVYNVKSFKKYLEYLKETIQKQLDKPSLQSEKSVLHMFSFTYENISHLKIDMDVNGAFNIWAKEKALELVKTYIEVNFEDRIQEIKIENNFIDIKWKSV